MVCCQGWRTKDAASTALDWDAGGSGQTFEGDLQGHHSGRAVRVEKKVPSQYESDKRQAPLLLIRQAWAAACQLFFVGLVLHRQGAWHMHAHLIFASPGQLQAGFDVVT